MNYPAFKQDVLSARFHRPRWERARRGWANDRLCDDCRQVQADRQRAERERADVAAAAVEAKAGGSWWRRS